MQYGIRISEDELGEDSKHYAGDYLKDFTCIQFATDYEMKDEELEKL